MHTPDLRQPARQGPRALEGLLRGARLRFNPQFTDDEGRLHGDRRQHLRDAARRAVFPAPSPSKPIADTRTTHRGAGLRLVRQPRRGRRAGGEGGRRRRQARARRAGPRLHVRATASRTSTATPGSWSAMDPRRRRRRQSLNGAADPHPPGDRRGLAHRVGAHHRRRRAPGARHRPGRGAGAGRARRRARALAGRGRARQPGRLADGHRQAPRARPPAARQAAGAASTRSSATTSRRRRR